ncbi:MAG: hypothetical protein QOH90_992, partial [Actinomycetota bacterium]|nr:hypothetical protein [Actinomycetota bacterium]
SELEALDVEGDAIDVVVDAFGRHRLLTFDREISTREPTVEIAHEALLRAWGRLRTWIDDAREDLRQDRSLARAATEWRASEADDSFLLRGARLEQHETWAATTDLVIGRSERAYLKASVDHRDREGAEEDRRHKREIQFERRSSRRLRGLVVLFAGAALVTGSLTVAARHQRSRAEREARIATSRELAASAVASLEVDPELSVLLARAAIDTTRSAEGTVLPEAEEALHRAVVASRLELEVAGLGGYVAWSAAGVFVTEGPENSGVIDIRDAETGERVLAFKGHDIDLNTVAFSPDGSRLATTGDDGKLKVWDPTTGRLVASMSGPGSAWGPSFSGDGSLIASAWGDKVRVFALPTKRVLLDIPMEDGYGTALSPDGKRLAAISERSAVYDVRSGKRVFGLGGHGWALSWSPDGRYVATGGEQGVRVWDARTGKLRHTLFAHGGPIGGVAWSPDSSRLVTGGSDGTVKIWRIDPTGVTQLFSLSAHGTRSGVLGVAFSPDGTRVMAGDLSTSAVTIWDLGADGDAEWGNLPSSGEAGAKFMPDGRRVVASSNHGKAVTIWDLQTGRALERMAPSTDDFRFFSLAVNPDGGSIALGGAVPGHPFGGEVARVWDTASSEEIYSVGHKFDVNEVAFSPDGEYMVSADWNSAAKIVDRSGRVLSVLREPGFSLSAARFSSDGRFVITASFEGTNTRVKIWDWGRREVVRTIHDDVSKLWPNLDVAPSGSRFVVAGPEGAVDIWDATSGTRVAVLAGPSGGVNRAVFSPDGERVATANDDGTVRLFDADSGAEQLILRGSGCAVRDVAFSGDGKKLASTSCDGVRIWALDIDDLLQIADHEVERSLTDAECRQYLHVTGCPQGA